MTTPTPNPEQARHTPGPWTVDEWHYESFGQKATKPVIIGPIENEHEMDDDDDMEPKQDAVCELYAVYSHDDQSAKDRRTANARLIAAAPDGYAIIRAEYDSHNGFETLPIGYPAERAKAIVAYIRKVEGRAE